MSHWTDDPKIHNLMTHLGKVGQSGNPTRSAYVAEQVNRLLVQVESRLSDRRKAAKEEETLAAEYDKLRAFVSERVKREKELHESIREAKQDLVSQNPRADTRQLDQDASNAVAEFEDDQEKAVDKIEELTKSITMKRTAMRRLDDRIEHYRKQVYTLIAQLEKGKSAAA
jgi:chromosome segregation ATPase